MNGGVTFGDTNVQVSGTVSGAETWYLLSAKTYSPATHRPLWTYLCPQVVAHNGQARGIEADLATSSRLGARVERITIHCVCNRQRVRLVAQQTICGSGIWLTLETSVEPERAQHSDQ